MNANLMQELRFKLNQQDKQKQKLEESEQGIKKPVTNINHQKTSEEISTFNIIESMDQDNNMIFSFPGFRKSRKEVKDILSTHKNQSIKQSMHETIQQKEYGGKLQSNMKSSCRQISFKFDHQQNFQNQLAEMTRVTIKFQEIMKSQVQAYPKKKIDQVKLIIKLQRRYHFRKWKLKFLQQIEKKKKHRKYIIEELIYTEEFYINDLNLIIKKIQEPCTKILSQKDLQKIFGNLSSIFKLNSSFLAELKARFENYNSIKTKFSDIFLKYVQFFRIYSEYLSDYEETKGFVGKLSASNLEFKQLISQMTNSKEFKFLDLESYLIKPIQRLPKYNLLIRDLQKQTNKIHCDYNGISKALEEFEKLNKQNDCKLNWKIVSQKRLFELAKLFPQVKIAEPNRFYVGEEYLLFIQDEEKNSIVYQFNDLILITEKGKLLYELSLDESSNVIANQDTKNYKNMFTICGKNGSATFSSEFKQEKMKFYQQLIDQIIQNKQARQEIFAKNQQIATPLIKRNNPIHVIVLPFLLNYKEVYYAVEISICNISQKIYITYNDCLIMQQKIKILFPQIELNFIVEKKNNEESKQIQMQNFLLSLLSSFKVKQNPSEVLQLIGLPKNFYDLPSKIEKYIKSEEDQSGNNSRRIAQDFNIESINEKIVKYEQEKHPKQQGNQQTQEVQKIKIQTFLPQIETIEISITKNTKTINLYDTVQAKLGLSNIFDFKFVLIQDQFIYRPLEDDELLFPIVKQSFWSSLFSDNEPIYFRKYLFLDAIVEETLCKQDFIRLKMIQNQLLNDIKNGYFILHFQEYCFFASLFFLLNTIIDVSKQFPKALLEKIIPNSILKTTKQDVWQQNIPKKLKQLCSSIMEQSKQMNKDIATIAQMIFISSLQKNQLFGVQLFLVRTSDLTKQSHKNLDQNPYIGVSRIGIQVFDNKRETAQLSLEYYELMPVKIFQNTLQLNTDKDFYQFEGASVKNIIELMDEYQELELFVRD